MDIREFMQQFVASQVTESPDKMYDPQVELLIELQRQADLNDRLALIQNANEGTQEESEADAERKPQEELEPAPEFHADASPQAVPADQIEDDESEPFVVAAAAEPVVEETADAEPLPPPVFDSLVADAAQPEEFAGEAAEAAEAPASGSPAETSPAQPEESQTPPAEPQSPPELFTADAEPARVASEPDEIPTPRVQIEGFDTTKTFVPDTLPFDFDGMLASAAEQIEIPRHGEYVSSGGDGELLPHLPDFEPLATQPSTDFAESRIMGLSAIWKQWERNR